MRGTRLPLIATAGPHCENKLLTHAFNPQMDSAALESTLGGAAQQRTPLEVLTQIEGPTSCFQQDALDYFCYTQLASQVPDTLPLHPDSFRTTV